jgi:4-aminobutyrate aminotransferase-like enzyme
VDDVQELLGKIKQGTIEATRPQMGKRSKKEADLAGAMRETFRLVTGGAWVPSKTVKRICENHHVAFAILMDEMQLGLSDSGKWVCDPAFSPPDLPPDEVYHD